jgi:hypothetical protein
MKSIQIAREGILQSYKTPAYLVLIKRLLNKRPDLPITVPCNTVSAVWRGREKNLF